MSILIFIFLSFVKLSTSSCNCIEIFRLFHPTTGDHMLSYSENEGGYTLDFSVGYGCSQPDGDYTRAIYRLYNGNDHMSSISSNEGGYQSDGIIAYAKANGNGVSAVYRLFNGVSDHMDSFSTNEGGYSLDYFLGGFSATTIGNQCYQFSSDAVVKSVSDNTFLNCDRITETSEVCNPFWPFCSTSTTVHYYTGHGALPNDDSAIDEYQFNFEPLNIYPGVYHAIKTSYNTYLSAQPDGSLQCDRTQVGAWEEFQLVRDGDHWNIKSKSFGKYLTVQASGVVRIDQSNAGITEQFSI